MSYQVSIEVKNSEKDIMTFTFNELFNAGRGLFEPILNDSDEDNVSFLLWVNTRKNRSLYILGIQGSSIFPLDEDQKSFAKSFKYKRAVGKEVNITIRQ